MSVPTDGVNKAISIILYLALIAIVRVLGRSFEAVRRGNPPPPVLEISLTPTPYRDPEALKRAISMQLEDILRIGGYYDAEVLISGNTFQVYTRGVPPELIAQDVMRQRTIVETLNKLGIRLLEMRNLDILLTDPIIYELNWTSDFSKRVKPISSSPTLPPMPAPSKPTCIKSCGIRKRVPMDPLPQPFPRQPRPLLDSPLKGRSLNET